MKLVDDTFVNANTGDVVELHGMSWVSDQSLSLIADGV